MIRFRRLTPALLNSSDASRGVQRSEGFVNGDTVEQLFTNQEIQKQVPGQVVWIDEAGLLPTPDMKRVFDLAEQLDFRIILSGDTGQHAGVKRGDALRILERDAGMKTAERQACRCRTSPNIPIPGEQHTMLRACVPLARIITSCRLPHSRS